MIFILINFLVGSPFYPTHSVDLGEKYQVDSEFVDDVNAVSDTNYDEIFNFLTYNTWEDSGCLPSPSLYAATCTRLDFKKNGEYSWGAASDYVERSEGGKWNFVLNSPNSGLFYFDNGSILPFKKTNNDLLFRYDIFMPSNEINYSSVELKLNRNSLPKTIPSDMYFKLIQNPWKKTNDFDLNMSPDLIIFKDNGRFFASYRNNQCSHEGTWGVDGRTLISISDPNDCDLRGHSSIIAASNEKPTFENDVMVFFQDSYYNQESEIEKKMFTFDRYGKSIKVKGEYSGNFKTNNPTTIDLTFQNVGSLDKELGEFTIKLLTCGPPQPNTGCSDTKEDLVITKNYTGILLHTTEIHHDSVTIIPKTEGDNFLKFSLKFEDERQPYHTNHGYVLNIG